MAHTVRFSIPERKLGKADIEFKVARNGSTIGALKVSKGTVVWVRRNASYGHKLSWIDFDRVMQDQGKREKRR